MTDLSQKPLPIFSLSWLKTPWTIAIIIPILVLIFDGANIGPFMGIATKAFAGTLPYIVFAVTLIAFLKAAGAETIISEAFKGNEVRMIFFAALFGGLAPFCSCEVIPFIAGLLALGTPLSAVMAFWLASPLIDPPTLLITAGALGWPFAIGKAISAVALGMFGGFAMLALMRTAMFADPLKVYKQSGCGASPITGKPVWKFWHDDQRREVFKDELISNAIFLIKWLMLAYILEAVLISYVPAKLIAALVGGDGVLPVVVAALVGMPAYLNSYVAPPMLAGLLEQGMSSGAAMSFMIAGAVSCIPAMAAVWSLVKPKVFVAYILFGISGAIISGLIFQLFVS